MVERIGNRSTRIRRVDGVHILVPNSQMLERVVVNWTLIDKQIRTTVRIGVAYGSQPRQVADYSGPSYCARSQLIQGFPPAWTKHTNPTP